jgi:anti-sigma regulatory factor (Ser/Thr protein kinase)
MTDLRQGTWAPVSVVRERCELAAGLDAPRRARVLAREILGGHLDGRARNDLLVLVTELVTNAVRHAGLAPGDPIVLHLAAADGVVRAEVCEPGPGFEPVEREPGPDGGFGLVLLRTLSSRWGISGGEGTCVWFEIDAPS